jgi:hypothetical protein
MRLPREDGAGTEQAASGRTTTLDSAREGYPPDGMVAMNAVGLDATTL